MAEAPELSPVVSGIRCSSHFVTVLSRDAVCSGLLISRIPSGTNKTPGTKTRPQGMFE